MTNEEIKKLSPSELHELGKSPKEREADERNAKAEADRKAAQAK